MHFRESWGAPEQKFGFPSKLAPRDPPIQTFRPAVNIRLCLKPDFAPNGRPKGSGYHYGLTVRPLLPSPQSRKVRKKTPEERARQFQAMLDSGVVENRAQLARLLGCSGAWVTKVPGRTG